MAHVAQRGPAQQLGGQCAMNQLPLAFQLPSEQVTTYIILY